VSPLRVLPIQLLFGELVRQFPIMAYLKRQWRDQAVMDLMVAGIKRGWYDVAQVRVRIEWTDVCE